MGQECKNSTTPPPTIRLCARTFESSFMELKYVRLQVINCAQTEVGWAGRVCQWQNPPPNFPPLMTQPQKSDLDLHSKKPQASELR